MIVGFCFGFLALFFYSVVFHGLVPMSLRRLPALVALSLVCVGTALSERGIRARPNLALFYSGTISSGVILISG